MSEKDKFAFSFKILGGLFEDMNILFKAYTFKKTEEDRPSIFI